jgi:hypothetical protein
VYARDTKERTLTLGVSGSLWKDALIMFDRETGSLWTQVSGEALRGPLEGERLRPIPSIVTTWRRWKSEHPETLVLAHDPDLSHSGNYQAYHSDPAMLGIFGTRNPDERLPGKEQVLGVPPGTLGNHAPIAYVLSRIDTFSDIIGGVPVFVSHDRESGAAGVFRRGTGRPEGTGQPEAAGLEPVPATRAYWFAWAAFYPQSEIRPAPGGPAPR